MSVRNAEVVVRIVEISAIASAVAYTSASVALAATTVTASGPAAAGIARRGSIRWWSRRAGPEPSRVAS